MSQEKVSVSANEFRRFKLNVPIPMGCAIITTVDVQGGSMPHFLPWSFPGKTIKAEWEKKE